MLQRHIEHHKSILHGDFFRNENMHTLFFAFLELVLNQNNK